MHAYQQVDGFMGGSEDGLLLKATYDLSNNMVSKFTKKEQAANTQIELTAQFLKMAKYTHTYGSEKIYNDFLLSAALS